MLSEEPKEDQKVVETSEKSVPIYIISVIAYITLLIFTLYSLLNHHADHSGYFMNTSLLNQLTLNQTTDWHFKAEVFPSFLNRIRPFFAGSTGKLSALDSKILFVTNIDVNFVNILLKLYFST